MQYKKLFRQEPPIDLVTSILRATGLLGMEDLRWFTKDELVLTGFEEWLLHLEPYYLPCKAKRFLHGEMDGARLITIFRHIVRPHGYDIHVQERLYKEHKHTLYQIQPNNPFRDLSGASMTVEFT
ncbi:hypothetical protein EBR66_07400 [bacterium]|nr:hypothetical protein [bacterium]